MKVWIEKSIVKGRKDRLEGDLSLGKSLWSPTKDKRGADIYSSMRDVQKGDIVLHLTDNKAIIGVSKAASSYYEGSGAVGSDWEGPAYIVTLDHFFKFDPPLAREDLLKDENREILDHIRSNNKVFYNSGLSLNQGAYLTEAPLELVKLINNSYKKSSNNSMNYINEYLKKLNKYFVVGAYWDGSNPADQTIRFYENSFWENGYDDKFIDEVNNVPEGSKIAIKAVFTRNKTKSVMSIKARGTVVKNYNNGKKLKVSWDKNFSPFEVSFSGGYWATIKEVMNKEHINEIFYLNGRIISRFEVLKNKFDISVFSNYIKNLRKIISELNLKPNDDRIVYSISDNVLKLTIGQRYCFNLYLKSSNGVYGVISKDKLRDTSTPFEGSPPQPYYNYYISFNPQKNEWDSIIGSIKDELNRTTKSGFKKNNNSDFENYVFEINSDNTIKDEHMNFPLNTILYGPPGTGKTYNTILKAAEIIENRVIDSYDEALKIFKANLHNRIEFITFHQNYSYEDFIQGLRPDTENDNQLTFERKDGVFKQIADIALINLMESETPQLSKKPFKEVFNKFINPLIEGEDEEIEIKMKKVSYFITAISNKSISFRKASGGTSHTLSIKTLAKMYIAESVLEMQGLSSYYAPLIKELLKRGKDSTGKKAKLNRQNYVIIIDEINRANISRVFGELITLIEPDKRSHGAIPLEARLPSGDPFIVPSNLYIIGTMKTADKSIALLDIALRRRFEFESMYPKYDIEDQEIYDVDVLKKINEQVIKSKGHDFQIGHAYFMGENNDLIERMNKKVIPLLLEYYMNDEKEVKGILKEAGLKIEEKSWPLKISGKK
jgi:hypothetical protein